MMNMDIASGLLCDAIAGFLFYIFSSLKVQSKGQPKIKTWPKMVLYVAGGGFSLERGTDFLSIANSDVTLGHINGWGLLMSICLTCIFGLQAWESHVSVGKLKQGGQLRRAKEAAYADPGLTVVALNPRQVRTASRRDGFNVNADGSDPYQ